MAMAIGEVARRSGSTVPTVRYYEDVGLLRTVSRGPNGRRLYGWPDVSRLTFIRRSRDLGLSIAEVKTMLGVADRRSDCADARDVVLTHLGAVRRRRAELEALEVSLQAMADRCDAECAGGQGVSCILFEDAQRVASQ